MAGLDAAISVQPHQIHRPSQVYPGITIGAIERWRIALETEYAQFRAAPTRRLSAQLLEHKFEMATVDPHIPAVFVGNMSNLIHCYDLKVSVLKNAQDIQNE